jgi:hypothetical protein
MRHVLSLTLSRPAAHAAPEQEREARHVTADTTTPPGEPYRESTEFAWTERAFGMLERGEMRGEVTSSRGIIHSRVWGPCPRCQHALDDQQTLTAVTNLPGGEWRGWGTGRPTRGQAEPRYYDVDVSCGCGDSHSGAPEGKTGCGVSFRVELAGQPGAESGQA